MHELDQLVCNVIVSSDSVADSCTRTRSPALCLGLDQPHIVRFVTMLQLLAGLQDDRRAVCSPEDARSRLIWAVLSSKV